MGVRICTSAQLRMPDEIWNSKLPDFVEGSGQPQTAARFCFMLKYGCPAPIAANALVSRSVTFELIKMPNQGSVVWRGCACSEVQLNGFKPHLESNTAYLHIFEKSLKNADQ